MKILLVKYYSWFLGIYYVENETLSPFLVTKKYYIHQVQTIHIKYP